MRRRDVTVRAEAADATWLARKNRLLETHWRAQRCCSAADVSETTMLKGGIAFESGASVMMACRKAATRGARSSHRQSCRIRCTICPAALPQAGFSRNE